MPYQVRTDQTIMGPFESQEEALACVRNLLQRDPNAEPEVRDSSTGEPLAPGASKSWREELANEIGY